MSLASEHLMQYGVTVENAREFIMSHLDNPTTLFNVAKQFSVTNEMLGEIVGVPTDAVRNFFGNIGLDYNQLESNQVNLPVTYTATNGTVFDIVVGTPGNDYFTHSAGNKIYLGMGGDDTFSNAPNASGEADFIGGAGNDVYSLMPAGLTFIKDIGGGSDTVHDNVFGYPQDNYTLDNRYLYGDVYDDAGNYLTTVVGGDLTDPNDYIENFVFPGYQPLNQDSALEFLKGFESWQGNVSSSGIAAQLYDEIADIVGIYNQYVSAGY